MPNLRYEEISLKWRKSRKTTYFSHRLQLYGKSQVERRTLIHFMDVYASTICTGTRARTLVGRGGAYTSSQNRHFRLEDTDFEVMTAVRALICFSKR